MHLVLRVVGNNEVCNAHSKSVMNMHKMVVTSYKTQSKRNGKKRAGEEIVQNN